MRLQTILSLFVFATLLTACAQPPEAVQSAVTADVTDEAQTDVTQGLIARPVNIEKSTFHFEGYGPGKAHLGTFKVMEGTLYYEGNTITAAKGTIDASSVDTGIEALDNHLKSPDFFDVEQYPTITMESTRIADGKITGVLTFHGISKEITFPANVTNESVSADFLLDSTPFGMKFAAVDKDVRIQFHLTG